MNNETMNKQDNEVIDDFSFAASLSRLHTIVKQEEGEGTRTAFSYTLRGLQQHEIPKWARFCASVFSYKANPPPAGYFKRHYYNDPHRGDVSLIRVAVVVCNGEQEDDEIVASCRIFQRYIANGCSPVSSSSNIIRAGGIGEVCTSSNHRRRGLSKELLQDCIQIMTNMKMSVSFLHAAPAFFPVYKSAGYFCTMSRWSNVKILYKQLLESAAEAAVAAAEGGTTHGYQVRLANFPADTHQLWTLHQSFVSHHGFAGCIIRSKEYWNDYLSQELRYSLWVLEKQEDCSSVTVTDPRPNNNKNNKVKAKKIVAWLSIRSRDVNETKWQLRDFGYSLDHQQRADSNFLPLALVMFLQNAMMTSCHQGSFELHLPTFVLEQLDSSSSFNNNVKNDNVKNDNKCTFIDWNQVDTENDEGWMYRPLLCQNDVQETAAAASQQQLPETWKRHNIPHLIWPADSF